MFAADVRDSLPCRENHARPIPDRSYAQGTSGEPEIVLQSWKKVDHFRSHDSKIDNLQRKMRLRMFLSECKKKFKDRVLTKSKEINTLRSYTREGTAWRFIDMERSAATFDTVAMESEAKKGIIDDLDKFVVSKEAAGHKTVRRGRWKRGYLLYDLPGGTGSESSLISAMANYLSFDIYELNLTSLSFSMETMRLLESTTDRSIIAIKDFDCFADTQDWRYWLRFLIEGLSLVSGNDRIIVFTTNHKDRLDPALLYRYSKDFYIDKFSPSSRPRGLTGGGKNLQLDSTDQQSWVDFDAISNRAYIVTADRSVPIVCYSEKISTGETLKREFIDNSVLGLEDTQQYSGGRPDGAPKSLGATKRGYFVEVKSKEIKDNVDKAVKSYTREGIDWCSTHMERQVATFDTVAMKSEVKKGVIDDLDKFVVSKEKAAGHSGVRGKAWKRGYLLYDPPGGTGSESSLIAAMANYLSYDIFDFKLAGLSSRELEESLVSIPNCSIIAIKDFDCSVDMQDGPLNLNKMGISELLTFIDSSLSSNGNDRIIVFTTNHKDRLDLALLVPFMEDFYIHKSSPSPQPRVLTGGENLQLDSTDQPSLADQSVPIVCYSEKISTGEALEREFIDNGALSLDDIQLCSGGRPDDAPKSLGDTFGQGLRMPDSLEWKSCKVLETLPLQEQTNDIIPSKRELITKGVLSLEDHQQRLGSGCEDSVETVVVSISNTKSILRLHEIHQRPFQQNWATMKERPKGVLGLSIIEKLDPRLQSMYISKLASSSPLPLALPYGGEIVGPISLSSSEVAAMNIKSHLVSQDQSASTASHSEKKITRVTTKREGITSGLFRSADGQQHFGSRHKDSAKGLGGFPTTDSLVPKSFKLRETLRIQEQPNGVRDFVLRRRLKIGGCVRLEKLPDLPQIQQMNCSGGLTLQSATFSQWTIRLPRGEPIVELDPFEQSAENAAYGAREDQSYMVYLSEKKIERKTLKRKFRVMCVLSLQDGQQHTCGKCEDAANSLGVKRICREHEINQVSTVKRIGRQNGIYRCLFEQSARTSHWPISLPDGGPILQLELLEPSTNNVAHGAKADQSCPIVSLSNKKILRKTLNRECRPMTFHSLENHQQHFGSRCEDSAKSLGVKRICREHGINQVSTVKCIRRQHRIHRRWWPFQRSASFSHWTIGLTRGEHIVELDPLERSAENAAFGAREDPSYTVYLSEKKIVRKTLKRKFRIMCVHSLQNCRRHTCGQCEDVANGLARRICREHGINQVPTVKHICRQNWTPRWIFQQSASTSLWPVGLPDGGPFVQLKLLEPSTNNVAHGARADQSCPVYLSNKKILKKTSNREFRPLTVPSLKNQQQHFGSRCEDSVKSLGVKRIRRQHGVRRHRWPFRRKWISMKGYSLDEERPVEVMGLSMHEKLVSRLQCIYRSRLARSSHWPSAIRNGGKIVGHIALSSSEFSRTNNRPHLVRQDQSGSNAPHPEKRKTKETTNKEWTASSLFSKEDLQQHFGSTRKDAAKKLGVSVSTLKRICRDHGIKRWENRRRDNVWRPPDPHGEGNTSSTCETLAINERTRMQNGIGGQNLESNDFLPNSFEDLYLLNEENGSIAGCVNLHTSHSEPCYSPDMGCPFSPFYREFEAGGGSFDLACQLNDPSTLSTAYANPSDPMVQQSQIASTQMLSENMGRSEGFRLEQHFWPEHVSGYNCMTLPTCSGPVPDQQMPSTPYVMPTNPQMSPLMERQDMRYVTVKATYGFTNIIFDLPLTSGIIELRKEVARRLEFDSFYVEYEDEERDWIRIALDEDLSRCLRSSLANPIVRLRVIDRVANGPEPATFAPSRTTTPSATQ